ncbi:MAG TPA: apolipoprotein N-acyltransferase [Luteibaculaceae bacterium]|nr:apolipoprotein N-acyltransferase [Luteibaculaceae bacterium]
MKRNHTLFLAPLGGVMLGLSWPHIADLTPLAFLGFGCLFAGLLSMAAQQTKVWRAFLSLYTAFFAWNLIATHWLFQVDGDFATRFISAFMPSFINSFLMALPFVTALRWWSKRNAWVVLSWTSAGWIGFEYLHLQWDLSWPWLNLGNVFANSTALVQWYEYTGSFGGTVWILLTAALLAQLYLRGSLTKFYAAAIGALIVIPCGLSLIIGANTEVLGQTTEVLIMQPNLDPYGQKFRVDPLRQLQTELAELEKSISPQSELLLFPETDLQEGSAFDTDPTGRIVPIGMWEGQLDSTNSLYIIRNFQQKHPKVNLLIGASTTGLCKANEPLPIEARPVEGTNLHYVNHNSALWISEEPTRSYHKSKLVPAAEILPFATVIKPLLGDAILNFGGASTSLSTQANRVAFGKPNQPARFAPVICYESVYGSYVGDYVKAGANLICIMTNDGWWDVSAGHKQHLAYAKLRAIEHRKDVLRSANTGISAHINAKGEILQSLPYGTAGVIKCQAVVHTRETLYTRWGDYVAALAIVACALIFSFQIRKSN